ncbi:MAG: membrane protein insertase YidC [Francisellaceae bacterium]
MKANYIRIFLLAVIVVIFMQLMAHWQTLFHPQVSSSNAAKINDKTPAQSTQMIDSKAINNSQSVSQTFDISTHKPIIINTSVFKNVEISPQNGAIIGASLQNYHVSLKDQDPMPLLNDDKGTKYIAVPSLMINGKAVDVLFDEHNVKTVDNITTVTLKGHATGFEITREYAFNDQSYDIQISQQLKNTSANAQTVVFNNRLIRQHEAEKSSFSLFDAHSYSFQGAALSSTSERFQKESFKDLNESSANVTTKEGWAAMIQHYFIGAWAPEKNDTQSIDVYAKSLTQGTYETGISTTPVVIEAGKTLSNQSQLYLGPIIKKNLEAVYPYLDKALDYGILSFISVIIFWLLNLIHTFVGNWGVAIILVTVIIKMLFYPLSAKSYRSMAKMRLLQPRMKKLQELYKGDRQKLGRKMMELYREEKVNPASGCLPILIQIPVFIALYWVLLESVQLRQAPFIFWIHDLATKDPYFILPILMGISMFVQQRISPTTADPTQAKIMMAMPVIFTIFFASFPSGLVLYWLTNNVISILQQWYITRKFTASYKAKRA